LLTQAIGDILPSAIGVALSPVPIIAVILILGTPRARSNGPGFAAGWVLGLIVVNVIALAVTGGADEGDSSSANGVHIAKLVFGLLFIVMAARQWSKRPARGEAATMPAWMSSLDGIAAGRSTVLGAALSGVNPKNLALTFAAAASMSQAGLTGGQSVAAVAVFVIIASLTVAGPVVYFMVASERATKTLGPVKEFMSDHNAVIMMVVLLVLGAKLVGAGLAGLAN
jgi:heme/copper-type cytochrome/quinol oxidase subunit 3